MQLASMYVPFPFMLESGKATFPQLATLYITGGISNDMKTQLHVANIVRVCVCVCA